MRVIDKNPIYLYLSIAVFYISSFSISFMPSVFDETGRRSNTAANTLAILFWAGIVLGIVLTLIVRKKRMWDVKWNENYLKTRKRRVPVFLHFFSNKPAIVFDSLLIAGSIALITSGVLLIPEGLVWIFVFLTVFSLEMHCIFNGLNYKWLKS